ncbi:MAG: hypothetical protein PHV74_12570 [Dehalococcoidia bacterium]|nr:hypothetical protein [Dehalococcoidia bacterium]
MAETLTQGIIALLGQGKLSGEIIGMGFRPGTVYAIQRRWRQEHAKAPTVQGKEDAQSDPEIVQMRKKMEEIEKELSRLKMPSDVAILIAAARQAGKDKRDNCPYEKEGWCAVWDWKSPEEIPNAIGKPVSIEREKPVGRIRLSPLYCAMCSVLLEEYLTQPEDRISD